jgi:hypothetical protein
LQRYQARHCCPKMKTVPDRPKPHKTSFTAASLRTEIRTGGLLKRKLCAKDSTAGFDDKSWELQF